MKIWPVWKDRSFLRVILSARGARWLLMGGAACIAVMSLATGWPGAGMYGAERGPRVATRKEIDVEISFRPVVKTVVRKVRLPVPAPAATETSRVFEPAANRGSASAPSSPSSGVDTRDPGAPLGVASSRVPPVSSNAAAEPAEAKPAATEPASARSTQAAVRSGPPRAIDKPVGPISRSRAHTAEAPASRVLNVEDCRKVTGGEAAKCPPSKARYAGYFLPFAVRVNATHSEAATRQDVKKFPTASESWSGPTPPLASIEKSIEKPLHRAAPDGSVTLVGRIAATDPNGLVTSQVVLVDMSTGEITRADLQTDGHFSFSRLRAQGLYYLAAWQRTRTVGGNPAAAGTDVFDHRLSWHQTVQASEPGTFSVELSLANADSQYTTDVLPPSVVRAPGSGRRANLLPQSGG